MEDRLKMKKTKRKHNLMKFIINGNCLNKLKKSYNSLRKNKIINKMILFNMKMNKQKMNMKILNLLKIIDMRLNFKK